MLEGWNALERPPNRREGSGVRSEGYNTSVDTGVVALTVKGILRHDERTGESARRARNSGGFRARRTLNERRYLQLSRLHSTAESPESVRVIIYTVSQKINV